MSTAHQQQAPGKDPASVTPKLAPSSNDTGGWSKRKAAIITASILGAYVLLYPIYAILDYFNYISSDHGVGMLLYVFFMPLGYLEQQSESVRMFFKWLIDLCLAPFF